MTNCPNCNKVLLDNHSFCPNCGQDLRESISKKSESITSTKGAELPNTLTKLKNPNISIWVSLFVGIIVMEIRNGFYKHFFTPNSNISSLIGSIIGAGAGFLIVVLILPLTISLIIYLVKKKFPKDEFASLVYLFTILVALFFLSVLF